MLVLFLCLLITTFLTGLLGYCLSSRLGIHLGHHNMSLSIHCCLGSLFFCDLFLFLSLFQALKPYFVLTVTAIVVLVLGQQKILTKFSQYCLLYWGHFPNLLIACLCASTLALPDMVWGDTHLYHYPITRWMAEYGLVPGLGNLMDAYANAQGWFTLPAAWDHGILTGKMGALAGSFVISLLLLGLCSSVDGLKQNQNIMANSVFLISGTLTFCVLSTYHNILNSLSPDLMPQLTILICTWLWLNNRFGRKWRLEMVMLLGVFILAIRLSTAPMILVLGSIYLLHKPVFRLKKLCILILILIPPGLSSFFTSGCFFFPIPWLCFESPVSVTDGTAYHMKAHIQEYSRWCGMSKPPGAKFLDWIPGWLNCEYGSMFLVSAVTLSWFMLLLLPSRIKLKIPRLNEIIILHLAGTWFVLYNAPATRYGAAWFCLGIALPFAILSAKTLCKFLIFLRPTALFSLMAMGYYWIKHPMHLEIANHWDWDKHISNVIFYHSTKAFLNGDKVRAYILSDWACSLNKNHKAACSDSLFLLAELKAEELLTVQSEKAQSIRASIPIPIKRELPWIIPQKATYNFEAHYNQLIWEGLSILAPDTQYNENHCSSVAPPCIPQDKLSEIRLLKPEMGVSGGFRRADFHP